MRTIFRTRFCETHVFIAGNQCPSTIFNTNTGTPDSGPYLSLMSYNFTCAANYIYWPGDLTTSTLQCTASGTWNPNVAAYGCKGTYVVVTLYAQVTLDAALLSCVLYK